MTRLSQRVWIKIKSIYLRITLTKTIAAFFLFTFTFCFLHSFVQGFLYTLDYNANALTSEIVDVAGVPKKEFAWLTTDGKNENGTIYDLKLCNAIPMEKNASNNPCVTIFRSDESGPIQVPGGRRKRQTLSRRQDTGSGSDVTSNKTSLSSFAAYLVPINDVVSGNTTSVSLMLPSINGGNPTVLDEQCTRVVLYADQVLSNSRREEIALVGSEFWIFGISIYAIIYGSVPHLIAAFALRLLSTTWSAYSIWRTQDIHQRFKGLIEFGACGVDLFPSYFKSRTLIQLGDIGLNVIASLLMVFFVIRMSKTYSVFLFQSIGPPDKIAKIYHLLRVLLVCLQISVFVLITSACLWLDQLVVGSIASVSSLTTVYAIAVIGVIVALPPFFFIGWHSLSHEQPRAFIIFLAIGVLLEAGWSLMYDSLVWRWTWIQWPFFASLAVSAQVALLACIAVGTLCRINFGKGLKEYLAAARALADDDFEPEMFDSTGKDSDYGYGYSGEKGNGDLEWGAEKKRRNARTKTLDLDFGARQPLPPASPPAYAAHAGAGDNDGISVGPLRDPQPQPQVYPARPAAVAMGRPPSGSMMVAVPTLGKNAPWQMVTDERFRDGEDEFSNVRL